MADSDKSQALIDEIKNAPAPEELNVSAPVVAAPASTADTVVSVPVEPSTNPAPVVDKAAAARIKAEEKAAMKAEKEQAKTQAKIDKKAREAAAFQEKIELMLRAEMVRIADVGAG